MDLVKVAGKDKAEAAVSAEGEAAELVRGLVRAGLVAQTRK